MGKEVQLGSKGMAVAVLLEARQSLTCQRRRWAVEALSDIVTVAVTLAKNNSAKEDHRCHN